MCKDKVLRPVYPNAGLEAEYRRKLRALVDEMAKSVSYWVLAQYRSNEPEIAQLDPADGLLAQDASPTAELADTLRELSSRWQSRFDEAAKELAAYFSKAAADRSDRQLRAILRKGGFSVKFRMTRSMNDVLRATIGEQVGLIRSIPQKYLTDVQGAVMRSVQTGRDLGSLSKELQKSYGVTRRRAGFIARDQNNKSSAAFNRVRQIELGITEAEWRHSGAGKHPRPTHVKAGRDRARYKVSEGWFDPEAQKYILPGELPNCRCVSRSVIPGINA